MDLPEKLHFAQTFRKYSYFFLNFRIKLAKIFFLEIESKGGGGSKFPLGGAQLSLERVVPGCEKKDSFILTYIFFK